MEEAAKAEEQAAAAASAAQVCSCFTDCQHNNSSIWCAGEHKPGAKAGRTFRLCLVSPTPQLLRINCCACFAFTAALRTVQAAAAAKPVENATNASNAALHGSLQASLGQLDDELAQWNDVEKQYFGAEPAGDRGGEVRWLFHSQRSVCGGCVEHAE